MKINIEIDCTPQEARAFLGLPPVEPMQEALLARLQERLAQYLDAVQPDALMNAWLPGGSQGLAALQAQFWQRMTEMQAATGKKKS